ncbi:Hypothetical Protein FCC1311_075062 [Hondaea fermentalgiana]|uniref:Uncharacterized protein n=1 Tax=Hondaea fermentalgiana TaxID=2315210 RepID=A0A2R5GRL8_9STRA|nr:Hypothetical Protein FCC1311_075062 [Hondaea fermentalgiana]|eukprot:GBG31283.1 Hypothetical Protein FCC1311_075062 [Hondaea fermentalgiana]
MLYDQCPLDSNTWVPKLCKSGEAGECGCCIPKDECPLTDECKQKGGHCTPLEECPKPNSWVYDLCKQGNYDGDCGCCFTEITPTRDPTPYPTPGCDDTDECLAEGGECIPREECKEPNKWVFELCGQDPDIDCGCCIPEVTPTKKPTPYPTPGCDDTDECLAEGGECIPREECKEPNKWVPDLCTDDSTIDCGCCIPETDECLAEGGECIPREECKEPNKWVFELCGQDPDIDCGCCIPTLECPITDECKDHGGVCMEQRKMMQQVQLIVAVLAICVVAALGGSFKTLVVDEPKPELMELTILPAFLGGTHYGDPAEGCKQDEVAVRIQGIEGALCSPKCSAMQCPSDVPDGCDAKPQCILQDAGSGNKYCALACGKGTDCGEGASCQIIFTGIGICTYSD